MLPPSLTLTSLSYQMTPTLSPACLLPHTNTYPSQNCPQAPSGSVFSPSQPPHTPPGIQPRPGHCPLPSGFLALAPHEQQRLRILALVMPAHIEEGVHGPRQALVEGKEQLECVGVAGVVEGQDAIGEAKVEA